MPILADYFMSVTVPPTEENIGLRNPPIVVVDRYPLEDHKKHRFPENSQYCCIPGDAKIAYVKKERRRPYIFTFCFTLDDRSRSYGTSLFYYEKLKIDGEYRFDKKGRNLYVPRALCVLSHQPIFSVFNVFLRELYRNAILDSEDRFADEKEAIPKVDSFEALLRKGSICDAIVDDEFDRIPLERHISHFVDYCPSLEFGTLTQLTVFQKIVSIRMPPKTCLPFTDRLCFECLFTSLSPKNIAKALAAVVQERRVLLVSEQMDSLTLCAQALNSLLYPFRWYHPFIPILPLSITESISASFPFLFGVTTRQFQSDECQANLEGVIVIHLDYDKIVIPKKSSFLEFDRSFVKRLEKKMERQLPPPATRVLYCNNQNISESSFLVFEVVFGPGKLGIRLRSKPAILYEGQESVECVYLQIDEDDMTVTGPGKRVALLKRKPVLLAVNGTSMIGKEYKEVKKILGEERRPLVLRCQIGVVPAAMSSLLVPSGRSFQTSPSGVEALRCSAVLTSQEELEEFQTMIQNCKRSGEESEVIRTSSKEGDDLSISFTPEYDSCHGPSLLWSPLLQTPSEEEATRIHRYYNYVSPAASSDGSSMAEKLSTNSMDMVDFIESIRVTVMLEFCRLIGHYKKYFRDVPEGAEMNEILDKKGFLREVDEEDERFVKGLMKTQLFQHFIEDAFEYEDNYEINLFNDCVEILGGMDDMAERYIRQQLQPSNWKLTEVMIPAPSGTDLPEGWQEKEYLRDMDRFPCLNSLWYGPKRRRMKVELPSDMPTTIVPKDMKEMIKEMRTLGKWIVC